MDLFYTSELSPFGARLRITAALVGRDLPPIEPPPGGSGSDAMKAINPFGQTPTLRIGGVVLIESLALMDYVAEQVPDHPVRGADPVARARIRGIVLAHDNHVFAGLRPLLLALRDPAPDAALITTGLARLESTIAALTRLFDPAGLALGGTPTLADIAIAPFASLAESLARRFGVASPYVCTDRAAEWCRAAQAVPEIAADNARRGAALAKMMGG